MLRPCSRNDVFRVRVLYRQRRTLARLRRPSRNRREDHPRDPFLTLIYDISPPRILLCIIIIVLYFSPCNIVMSVLYCSRVTNKWRVKFRKERAPNFLEQSARAPLNFTRRF